jgi:hypothetical protein
MTVNLAQLVFVLAVAHYGGVLKGWLIWGRGTP